MAFAKSLRTPTLYDAIKDRPRIGEVTRYRFPASVRRLYHDLDAFPAGLVPFSDAIAVLSRRRSGHERRGAGVEGPARPARRSGHEG